MAQSKKPKAQNEKPRRKIVVSQKTIKFKEQMLTVTEHLRRRLYAKANLFLEQPNSAEAN